MRLIDADWLLDVVENIVKWDTERDKNRIIHQVRELTPIVNQWIPCSERLPKREGFYLVTLKHRYGAETNIRFFKIEDGKRYWSLWGNENITAWMPKPIPYQQKKEVTE